MELFVKEDGPSKVLNLDVNEWNSLPVKVSLKTLELLEKTHRWDGSAVRFNPEIEHFIAAHAAEYKKALEAESANQKEWNSFLLKGVGGPLFEDVNCILDVVSRVYEHSTLLPKEDVIIPKVNHQIKMEQTNDEIQGKVLDFQNVDVLLEQLGQGVVLTSAVLFVESLNKQHQNRTKTQEKPFKLSRNIKIKTFNEESGEHQHAKSFQGGDYVLEGLFLRQSADCESPTDLMRLVVLKEQIIETLEKKAKPKSLRH
jgi:hypothetical protein